MLGGQYTSIGAVTSGQTIEITNVNFFRILHINAKTNGIWAVIIFSYGNAEYVGKGGRWDDFATVTAIQNNATITFTQAISTGVVYKYL